MAARPSAWVYAVLAEHQWIIAQYPEQAQVDVWGDDPEAVASSSLAPRAAAERVPGGWRLSGHFPFSSGCDYAQWAILGAFLGEIGRPAAHRLSAGAARARSRSSTTGRRWASPAPAASRWCCTMCSCPSIAA